MSFGALFRRAAPDVEARQAATWPSVRPGAKHFADIVRDRTQLGHWEVRSDPVPQEFWQGERHFAGQRVSRFPIFLRNNDWQSRAIMDGLVTCLVPFLIRPVDPSLRPQHGAHRLPLPSGRSRRSDMVLRSAGVYPDSTLRKGFIFGVAARLGSNVTQIGMRGCAQILTCVN